MTSNKGAGFSSAPNKKWDPLSQHAGKTAGYKPLDKRGETRWVQVSVDWKKRDPLCQHAGKKPVYKPLDKRVKNRWVRVSVDRKKRDPP